MSRALTILSLSPLPIWTVGEGGGSLAIPLEQEGLARAGHQVHYLMLERGGNGDCKRYERRNGYHVHTFRIPRCLSLIIRRRYLNNVSFKIYYGWYYLIAFLQGMMLARKIRPDVVIGYTNYSALPAYLIGRIRKIPYIYRENGTWTLLRDIQTAYGRLRRFDATWAFRLPCAAMVLTDDGTQSDKVAKHYNVPDEKVHFWRNGIRKWSMGELDREKKRRELGLDPAEFIITSVGRLNPHKHIGELIEAFALLETERRCQLLLVGEGQERGRLERMRDALRINDRIVFVGALPQAKVYDYLIAADVVVALGSINPLLEGMSVGRCVITLDIGTTYDITNGGRAAVVTKETKPVALAEVLRDTIVNNSKRQEFERQAYEWIMRSYDTWETRIDKYVRLIEDIAYNTGKQ